MKTIVFFRHAEAERRSASGRDRDRALDERGREAARTMGCFLQIAAETPPLAVTSTARRAVETLDLARDAGGWPCRVLARDELYDSTPGAVLDLIQDLKEPVDSLLLVGHEPTWSDMVARFAGGTRLRLPAGSMARVDIAASSWEDVEFEAGQLVWLVSPKLLGDARLERLARPGAEPEAPPVFAD